MLSFNVQQWALNYEHTILGRPNFNLIAWAKNYEEKILAERLLEEEIKVLKKIEEDAIKRRRNIMRKMIAAARAARNKQQAQELMTLKLFRNQRRNMPIPYYCAAPSGGTFDIDEPEADPKLLSVQPSNEWLEQFNNNAQRHIPLLESGEDVFCSNER